MKKKKLGSITKILDEDIRKRRKSEKYEVINGNGEIINRNYRIGKKKKQRKRSCKL